jgi:hypothetical protein
MARTMLLLSILLLTGCGGAESPRFVPATGASPTVDHAPGDKASREVVIPKNIPMH